MTVCASGMGFSATNTAVGIDTVQGIADGTACGTTLADTALADPPFIDPYAEGSGWRGGAMVFADREGREVPFTRSMFRHPFAALSVRFLADQAVVSLSPAATIDPFWANVVPASADSLASTVATVEAIVRERSGIDLDIAGMELTAVHAYADAALPRRFVHYGSVLSGLNRGNMRGTYGLTRYYGGEANRHVVYGKAAHLRVKARRLGVDFESLDVPDDLVRWEHRFAGKKTVRRRFGVARFSDIGGRLPQIQADQRRARRRLLKALGGGSSDGDGAAGSSLFSVDLAALDAAVQDAKRGGYLTFLQEQGGARLAERHGGIDRVRDLVWASALSPNQRTRTMDVVTRGAGRFGTNQRGVPNSYLLAELREAFG